MRVHAHSKQQQHLFGLNFIYYTFRILTSLFLKPILLFSTDIYNEKYVYRCKKSYTKCGTNKMNKLKQ